MVYNDSGRGRSSPSRVLVKSLSSLEKVLVVRECRATAARRLIQPEIWVRFPIILLNKIMFSNTTDHTQYTECVATTFIEKKYCNACDKKTRWGYAAGIEVCSRCYVGSAEFKEFRPLLVYDASLLQRDFLERKRNKPTAFFKKRSR